jgi:small-conductance mechanosensitive channel
MTGDELVAKLAGRTTEEKLAILDHLAREWLARRGAVEVAHQRFKVQAEELRQARRRLAALKEPKAKAVPLVASEKDVDEAISAAQQLAEYHAARAQQLDEVVASTRKLLELAAGFDSAAHRFQINEPTARVAPAAAAEQGVPADKLPAVLTRKSTEAAADRLNALRTEVSEICSRSKDDLSGLEVALKNAKKAAAETIARHEELKAAREGMVAAFQFEERVRGMKPEPLTEEFTRLQKAVAEKTGALGGEEGEFAKAVAGAEEARAKLAAVKEPLPPPEVQPFGGPTLENAERQLFAAQQYLSARLRASEDRAEKTAALLAALDELEKRAAAYSATLDGARQSARQLEVAASEIARRVARGELEAVKVPEGVAEAATGAGRHAKLDADAKAVREALAKIPPERAALRKPDPDADNEKAMTATLLAHVSARLDRLTDFKKLAAEHATARKERPESEQRRLDQRAADRMARESPKWDPLIALDRSKPATDIANLLEAYYKELVELDERQESLTRQRQMLEGAVELTQKEAADVAKLRAMLAPRAARSESARQWDRWLAARLTPAGLKAEADAYRDELARISAVSGANARRVQALTGNEAAEASKTAEQAKLPATSGEIGRARNELFEARVRGWTITGIKVGLILLGALILPQLIVFALRRAIRGGSDAAGNPSPALAPLRGALKFAAWVVALALILSLFGFDVTALVVALAIGILAVGLAARPMIADVFGSLVISAERRFKVGDVVRLGGGEPARVIDLTWRSTALKNANGLVVSVPNRKVTETTVENLSRGTETYDSLAVTVNTDKDAGKVIAVIRAAMAQCKNVSPEHGVTVVSYNHKDKVKAVQYRFWWFLKDYEQRNKTRDEVFARVALGLAQEDMSGIEVTLA